MMATAYNTVYAVQANALTQMLGFASHFAYTRTVRRNYLGHVLLKSILV